MPESMESLTLSSLLGGWEDPDIARYLVACCLGILEYDESGQAFGAHKGVFSTPNHVSSMFDNLLDDLVQLGFLEVNDDGQYRYLKPERSLEEIAYNK